MCARVTSCVDRARLEAFPRGDRRSASDRRSEADNCTRAAGTCDTTTCRAYRFTRVSPSPPSCSRSRWCPCPAAAQDAPKIKPSQHGTVSQRIADTTITLAYNRPVARGRELFGALVPYGKIWCPCADDATTIELSAAVKIDGHELAAGKYSVWTLPNDGKWTVIFNRQRGDVAHQVSGRPGRAAPRRHPARRRAHGDPRVLFPDGRGQEGRAGAALGHDGRAVAHRRALSGARAFASVDSKNAPHSIARVFML